jgi:U3 small nucleolar RNA-associated protein 21
MSPNSDFLATTHIGDLGIYLWTNISLYKHVSLKPLPADFVARPIQMPTVKQSQEEIIEQGLEAMDIKDELEDAECWDTEQVASEMVTLANLPEARWQNLIHLDVIKARNKPKVAPEKPKNAPFFLPTVIGPDGLTR